MQVLTDKRVVSASPGRLARLLARVWKDRWIYVFLAPLLILYGAFTLWPTVASWYYSLFRWYGFEEQRLFVGLANFREAMADPLFWNAFRNTLVFELVVPVKVGLALVVAVILNSPRLPFARLFRTALFLPVVTTTAIVGVVMHFILDPAGGPLNVFLIKIGLLSEPVDFLGGGNTSLPTAMIIYTWKWFGITLVYWLAALQSIPYELYEAAAIDGASSRQSFRYITVPLLIPFAIIITLVTAVNSLRVFDLILTLTGGGPFFRSEVMEVYIYRMAFGEQTAPRLGYASAVGLFFGMLTIGFVVVQTLGVRYARRLRHDRA